MTLTQAIRQQDYELLCGATLDSGGKFRPTLVITKNAWPSRPRTIAVERGSFESQEGAIQAAHAQGLAWIANYG